MRIGKINENILKRSVLKNITYRSEKLLQGPAVGRDCGCMMTGKGTQVMFSANPVSGSYELVASQAFCRMTNDIACGGAVLSAMMVTLLLPKDSDEKELKYIMRQLGELAAKHKVDVLGGHTEISEAVNQPVLSLVGIGSPIEDCVAVQKALQPLQPGMDIVMTKWAGASGAAQLAKGKWEELKQRFSVSFLEDAMSFSAQNSCVQEAEIALKMGGVALHNASAEGVFGALWEFGSAYSAGLEVDLKRIPIRQESVEVCEFFDRNPYEIASDGVLLVGISDGESLVQEYEKTGIQAAVIGKITDGNDKVVVNGEERRFLVPPGKH